MEEYYDIAKAYFRGTISAADEKRLSEWLNEDKHALLFRVWEDEWRKQAKAQASEKTKAAWKRLQAAGIQNTDRSTDRIQIQPQTPLRWFRYAASVAVFAIIGGLAWWLWPSSEQAFMAQTGAQEQQNFVLSDGSEISLNESSSLTCAENFGKKTREVLFEGEASFSVAKDAERPFIIHSGDFSVTVLGTEFTLRAYPTDSIYTLQLTSGKVKVQYLQDSLLAETGDLVQFNTNTKQFRKKLEASNILLSDLVNRLERLYDVHIEVGDTALANETLFISINTDDSFEDVCAALEALLPIVIEQEEDHYRLAAQ